MKTLIRVFFLCSCSTCIVFCTSGSKPLDHQNVSDNPYLTLACDSMLFYDFDCGTDGGIPIINDKGALAHEIIKSVKPDKSTANEFNKIIGLHSSYGSSQAACFEPHLGVVYYKRGKAVASINICTSCNILKSSLPITAMHQGAAYGEGSGAYYTQAGMSKILRAYLNSQIARYHLSHPAKEIDFYDQK